MILNLIVILNIESMSFYGHFGDITFDAFTIIAFFKYNAAFELGYLCTRLVLTKSGQTLFLLLCYCLILLVVANVLWLLFLDYSIGIAPEIHHTKKPLFYTLLFHNPFYCPVIRRQGHSDSSLY